MAYVATITIDYTKVPGDLTDYVGLIVPDGSAGYSALYALCLESGGDIRLFKSDDTTELAREIVTFSVSAETGEIHYKYSGTLSSSVDTDIHVYADGSSSDYAVTATYGRNAVWADYEAVYHLDSDGTDSTGNGYGLTNKNSVAFPAGKIGGGSNAGTGNDTANAVATKSLYMQGSSPLKSYWSAGFTVSYWRYINDLDGIWDISFEDSASGAVRSSDTGGFSGIGDYGTLSVETWYHQVLRKSSNNWSLRLDGVQVDTHSGGHATTSGRDGLVLHAHDESQTGREGSNTRLDEFRVTGEILSDNWITAEYNNQNSYSTFYSVAAVAGGGGFTPTPLIHQMQMAGGGV